MALTLTKKTYYREARTAKDAVKVKSEKIELKGIDRYKGIDRVKVKWE